MLGNQQRSLLPFRKSKGLQENIQHNGNEEAARTHHICSHLLFLHAFTGCDTTSRIFGVEKKSALMKFLHGNRALFAAADSFTSASQSATCLEQHGNKAMVALFGGKESESLAALRHRLLITKTSSATTAVTPERLPPTESSTKHHSLRVYHQVMAWTDVPLLDPLKFGWMAEQNMLKPDLCDASPRCTPKIARNDQLQLLFRMSHHQMQLQALWTAMHTSLWQKCQDMSMRTFPLTIQMMMKPMTGNDLIKQF